MMNTVLGPFTLTLDEEEMRTTAAALNQYIEQTRLVLADQVTGASAAVREILERRVAAAVQILKACDDKGVLDQLGARRAM